LGPEVGDPGREHHLILASRHEILLERSHPRLEVGDRPIDGG
jgi:hypothetical protein